MRTRSEEILSIVKTLIKVQGDLKRLQGLERDLKDGIRAYMGTERLLEAGDACILIETRKTTMFDRDALTADMGIDFVKKYQKQTEYDCMLVRSTKKSE